MTPGLRDRLEEAIREAAGTLAFSDAIPIAPEPFEQPPTCVVIPLIEPESGSLVLQVSDEDAETLGRTAWGMYASGEGSQIDQFLFELVNVVAGQFMALTHPDAEVRIGFPTRISPEECPEMPVLGAWDLDGCKISVGVAG